ncbi:MAG: ATP-binding protein, partial [Acidobacteriota bacterium]
GVTGRRYATLISPLGTHNVTIIGKDGDHKTPEQLSRGTQEQLYLALRFGLIRQFAENAEPLPVIVDDILVNFDPERAARAAESFAELSKTNQVLVFTCHPETAQLFTTADARTQVISL